MYLRISRPCVFARGINQFQEQNNHPSSHANGERNEYSCHVTKVQLIAAFLIRLLGCLCLGATHAAASEPFLRHALQEALLLQLKHGHTKVVSVR